MEVAGSLLGANLLNLEEDVRLAEKWGIKILHFDQMDGHFVPNIAFGPAFVAAVRSITTCFLDVHLMLDNPRTYLEDYVKAGADSLTIHAEIQDDVLSVLREIHARNCKTCISINPETDPAVIEPYLSECDMVLVMLVQPGFGGQEARADCIKKLPVLRKMIDQLDRRIPIEVDGGVKLQNIHPILDAGADILVMGTGLYGAEDPEGVVREVKGELDARIARLGR
ncbi:MAG: ribulose-phosphate 3-epimerase [Clostridia bacterium]|nr:ribulose-phosphate 3-epimerase [Clostridia bacterium]